VIYGSIICLGDSLTEGSRDEYWRGYPVELELELYRRHKQNWNCINAGIAGQISIEIYKRAYGVCKGHPEAAELILLMGTNDSKEQIQTPPLVYAEHVEAVIRCALRWEKLVYLCTIPPLMGFGAPDFCTPALIEEYNMRLADLAHKYVSPLIDMGSMKEDCYADGVHLNNKGYKEMASRLADAIEQRRKWNYATAVDTGSDAHSLEDGVGDPAFPKIKRDSVEE